MRKIILLNKPYNMLCQFTDKQGRNTLADIINIKDVYAAGRLDYDSEGLVVLTNDGKLNQRLTNPKSKTSKTYWVQVEGAPSEESIEQLCDGVKLKDGMTLPAKVKVIQQPTELWQRIPAIRQRKNIPTTWISMTIVEGRNRQVRRMTAAVGHPTLRLIRYRVANWTIDGIENGSYTTIA